MAFTGQRFDHRLGQRGRIAVVDGYPVAVAGEGPRYGSPDSPRRSRNQNRSPRHAATT
jgi:hypothetical protein